MYRLEVILWNHSCQVLTSRRYFLLAKQKHLHGTIKNLSIFVTSLFVGLLTEYGCAKEINVISGDSSDPGKVFVHSFF